MGSVAAEVNEGGTLRGDRVDSAHSRIYDVYTEVATVKTQLAKWGNSLAVRIPKAAAEAAKFKAGDNLDLDVDSDSVTIRKEKRRPTIEELARGITTQNRHGETDWGERVGSEEW
jgi:antitoxin MazE